MEIPPTTLLLLAIALCSPMVRLILEDEFINSQQPAVDYDAQRTARYKYEIKTFDVRVDHFSFAIQDTFKLKYLVNDTWQKPKDPPIFFYTGNEGNIETFAQNTGFLWEIAPQFGALVVFAEHRYYGDSMPYGNKSFTDPRHLGYLTSEQAIADYVELIQYLRSKLEYNHSPVILFGGSYGGMLSAWMRMKYPHIVQGAIASSAPILQFIGTGVECESFTRITTSSYRASNPTCPELIRKSWDTITELVLNDTGKEWLFDNWKLCDPLKTVNEVNELMSFLSDIYVNLAMVNYPYETDFFIPLPGHPVDAFCQHLTNSSLTGKPLLSVLHRAISIYTNYTGKATCLSTKNSEPGLEAGQGWDYQACTEMIMPICSDGVNDMFLPQGWDLKAFNDTCFKKFSVLPRPYQVCQQYGCNNLSTVTNINFSNGLLDPWTSGGVLRNLSSSAIAILIPEAAHHLDLRESNSNDPHSVILTRNLHRYSIKKWIEDYTR